MSGANHLYAIAIGSNRPHGRYGRPQQVVEAAIEELDRRFEFFDASPILLNPAHGGAGRDFANTVVLIESDRLPPQILAELKAMEREFGRRRGKRWGSRVLDLDIILWTGGRWRCRWLTIPHASLEHRDFVLQPLAAVAPNLRVKGWLTANHLAQRLARRRPRG